jgi:glutamyl-tRNA reductase
MDSLVIYHFSRRDNPDLEIQLKNFKAPSLVTCQRVISFIPEDQEANLTENLHPVLKYDRLAGREMYHFILEVICGLRSSLLGETEIQGQFREFVKSHLQNQDSWIHRWNSLFQNLLTDSKEIRQNFLKDLGSHSYGSLTRKLLKEVQTVQVIGAGQLVQEIEPWLSEKHLQIYSRKNKMPAFNKKSKAPRESFHLRDFVHLKKSEALVVAAPISNDELQDLIHSSPKPITKLVDWRGENQFLDHELLKMNITQYFSFSQLTEQLSKEKKIMTEKLKPAFLEIEKKSEQFFFKMIVRPMGWDDLCA